MANFFPLQTDGEEEKMERGQRGISSSSRWITGWLVVVQSERLQREEEESGGLELETRRQMILMGVRLGFEHCRDRWPSIVIVDGSGGL